MGFLLKIAVFGVVAYIAWTTARRWLGLGNPPAQAPAPPPREATAQQRRPVVEEARLCTVCGAYVAANSGKCGRSDCPQG